MKVIIQPQAHYCGQCLHRAHQKILFQKKCSTHFSPSFPKRFNEIQTDVKPMEISGRVTWLVWAAPIGPNQTGWNLSTTKKVVVSGLVGKWRPTVSGRRPKWHELSRRGCRRRRFENRGENTRSRHKGTKKKHKFTDGYWQTSWVTWFNLIWIILNYFKIILKMKLQVNDFPAARWRW